MEVPRPGGNLLHSGEVFVEFTHRFTIKAQRRGQAQRPDGGEVRALPLGLFCEHAWVPDRSVAELIDDDRSALVEMDAIRLAEDRGAKHWNRCVHRVQRAQLELRASEQ